MNSHAFSPGALLWERLLGFFYPHVCQICRSEKATASDGFVCVRCCSKVDGVRFIAEPFCKCCGTPFDGDITTPFECFNCRDQRLYFRSARAAVRMTPLVQQVVHSYKYRNALWFERFLGDLFVQTAKPVLESQKIDYLVPIPLHWRKRWQRAFNQSERLAKILSNATGIPLNRGWLKRVQPTPTQTRFTRVQRAENVRRAFSFRGKTRLNGEHLVLIDDVLTTGATASACAKVLVENGAGTVDVWTVARGTLQ